MTRRDYERLARVIGAQLADPATTEEQAQAVLTLTRALIPVLHAENGRFDAVRFLRAVAAHAGHPLPPAPRTACDAQAGAQ